MQEKCCCSNEPIGIIPIARVISKLDMLFSCDKMQEAGQVLSYWENEARALNDRRGLLQILSEEIGYFRKINDKQKGLCAVDEALNLIECVVDDSISSATIYLNCATTMKAFGKAKESIVYYQKAKDIYDNLLEKDDYRFAGFFNNYATALADLKEFDKAEECYKMAIDILKSKVGYGEIAISYVNLAHLVYDRATEKEIDCDDEIDDLLTKAYDCLVDKSLQHDGNYAYICEKCADSFGFFGYFLQKNQLESIAREIYKNNQIQH